MTNTESGFKLYRAVVEDNLDPLKIGRVRVRIHGIHTEKNENAGEKFEWVQTDQLPWASVMGGTDFGLVAGVGLSSVLRNGTWVWVILENDDINVPIVFGTIKGVTSYGANGVYDGGVGFCDPEEEYPYESRSAESDLNRTARNEMLGVAYYDLVSSYKGVTIPFSPSCGTTTKITKFTTVHDKINSTINKVTCTDQTGAVGPTNSKSWETDPTHTEPDSLDDSTEYPESQVINTPMGSVITFDDTEGNERIRFFHKTGSYFEIRPDGNFIQRSVSTGEENYYIALANVNDKIEAGVKRYIKENLDEIIDGTVRRKIAGDKLQHVKGDYALKVDGDFIIEVDGSWDVQVHKDYDTTIDQNETRIVQQNRDTTINQNETKTVLQNSNTTIGKDDTKMVQQNSTTTINLNETKMVQQNSETTIGLNEVKTVLQNSTTNIGLNEVKIVGSSINITSGSTETHTNGGTHTIIAPSVITS